MVEAVQVLWERSPSWPWHIFRKHVARVAASKIRQARGTWTAAFHVPRCSNVSLWSQALNGSKRRQMEQRLGQSFVPLAQAPSAGGAMLHHGSDARGSRQSLGTTRSTTPGALAESWITHRTGASGGAGKARPHSTARPGVMEGQVFLKMFRDSEEFPARFSLYRLTFWSRERA